MRKWAWMAAAVSGLNGAGGIVLAAIAAHAVPDPRLQTAANFLLIHAAATLALCAFSLSVPRRAAWFLAPAGLFLSGSLLFGCDISSRVLAGSRLFPGAAPLGGTLLLAGWVLVAVATALACLARHNGQDKIFMNT